jgi:hypothetical protein
MSPELAYLCSSPALFEHRHPRLIDKYPRLRMDEGELPFVEPLEPPGDALHPTDRHRPVEQKALSRQHLHLAVERD